MDGAASNDVWAVGGYTVQSGEHVDTYSFAERWHGSRWNPVFGLPGETVFDAVAVNDVWAVGNSFYGALILHYDGTQWNEVPVPDETVSGWFEGIQASGVQPNLWAVGHRFVDGIQYNRIDNAPSATEGAIIGTASFSTIQITCLGPESGVVYAGPDYSIAGLVAGTYTLVVRYSGCTPSIYTVTVQPGVYTTQDVSISCSGPKS